MATQPIDPDWAWTPYRPSDDAPWNRQRAAHLLRRAGFGGTSREIDEAIEMDPAELVEQLVASDRTFHSKARAMPSPGRSWRPETRNNCRPGGDTCCSALRVR